MEFVSIACVEWGDRGMGCDLLIPDDRDGNDEFSSRQKLCWVGGRATYHHVDWGG